MTKEDEARLQNVRTIGDYVPHEETLRSFLLRLLDEARAERDDLRVKLNGFPFAIAGSAMDANITKRAVAANERARALEADVKKLTAERDEQAARVAELEKAGNELHAALLANVTAYRGSRLTNLWEAAIRARAGSPVGLPCVCQFPRLKCPSCDHLCPACATAEGEAPDPVAPASAVLARHGFEPRDEGLDGLPVAPGEVKP